MKTSVKHDTCERCLEPDYACQCIALDMGDYFDPVVVWTASRSVVVPGKPSVIHLDKKYRYARACREVKKLNRLDRGKIKHFILPVQ